MAAYRYAHETKRIERSRELSAGESCWNWTARHPTPTIARADRGGQPCFFQSHRGCSADSATLAFALCAADAAHARREREQVPVVRTAW